jgi:peptide/nickel transport system permease protein
MRLRRDKAAMISLGFLVLLVLVAIFAGPITRLIGHLPNTQYDSAVSSVTAQPVGPLTNGFFLGADQIGRDVLSRIIYGARVSLVSGVISTSIAAVVGTTLGLIAGYVGGWLDTVISRFLDVVLAFPFLLTAVSLVAVFSPSLGIEIAVLAFFSTSQFGRVVRGQVLSIREKEYIEAARSLGAGTGRIMAIDVLPNLLAPLIVYFTLVIPVNIVNEATLSFLGLGVKPPTATWGNMLADSVQAYRIAWWLLVFPALALTLTTLAFNLLGDGLRDALDPRAERVLAK